MITAARGGDDLPSLSKDDLKLLKRQVVEDLIDRALLLDAAKAAVSPPPADEVKTRLADALKQAGGNESQPWYLGQATEDTLRDGLAEDLWIRNYLTAIESSISVSDAEIKAVYEQHPDHFKVPRQFHLRQIVIDAGAAPDEALHRARDLADQIRSKQITFDEAVRHHSAGPARDRGGDLGYVSANQIPADIVAKIETQQLGIVGDPIAGSDGIHLIIVVDKHGGQAAPLDQAAAQIRPGLVRQKRDLAVEERIKEKRSAARIIRYLD